MNCEYLVLKASDAVRTGNDLDWNISPHYYSNQRSSVCFVSLHEIAFLYDYNDTNTSTGFDTPFVIRTNLNLQNQQTSDNNLGVLGVCMVEGFTSLSNPSASPPVDIKRLFPRQTLRGYDAMKLLVTARPTNIKIRLENKIPPSFGGTIVEESTTIILKFEYEENNQEEYLATFMKTIS